MRDARSSVRVAWVAERQWTVIGIRQLHDCGLDRSAILRWRRAGRLHLQLPGVYSVVGPASVPVEGHLVAALLFAGPGSVLSHATAAYP